MPSRVVFSPTVPPLHPNNAGETYLNLLEAELQALDTTYIVPSTPQNVANAADRRDLRTILVEDVRGPFRILADQVDRLLPSRPLRAVARAIRRDPDVVRALRRADIVDLQWPELVALGRLIRSKLPHVRIIATVHDVHSQKFSRQFLHDASTKLRLRASAGWLRAKKLERETASTADLILTFSAKDSLLFREDAPTLVVYPPLAVGTSPSVSALEPYVLFVGPLHRKENLDGLQHFLRTTWPLVIQQSPGARLLVAGRKPNDAGVLPEENTGLELLGFVDDLEALYQGASAVVAPLRLGAGLKFKSIDALVRGVPLVGTSVALEGVDAGEMPLTPSDSPEEAAAAIVSALAETPPRREHASSSWYQQRYGRAQFEHRIKGAYGLQASASHAGDSAPEVSVVIPVWNGELGISEQLDRLAFQSGAPRFEVVIADNGSTDRTRIVALAHSDRFLSLRVIDASAQRGVNYARNVGVLNARAEKVLICDHDDLVGPEWVAELCQALEGNELVSGRTVPVTREADGRLLERTSEAQTLGASLGYLPYALGGNLGVNRQAFLKARGFDQSFVGGHDEVEFSWRMQEQGARISAANGATLHYLQRSTTCGAFRQAYHSSRTRVQLWARYHGHAPLQQVSYRGALDAVIRAVIDSPGLLLRRRSHEAARRLGRALGGVVGHYRYRFVGRVPVAELLDEQQLLLGATDTSLTFASDEGKQKK